MGLRADRSGLIGQLSQVIVMTIKNAFSPAGQINWYVDCSNPR